MSQVFGPRRGTWITIDAEAARAGKGPSPEELAGFERFERLYRATCSVAFNFVPTSGHPGGSVSAGPLLTGLLFDAVDLDLSQPGREDADVISFAAGHKALGLYAAWALRDEVARLAAPELLPATNGDRLRLEDLLGFRRNPAFPAPLAKAFGSRALDGHPTPATPFVRLATGASGVGLAASIGLALAACDWFGDDAPHVQVVEGEGGLTPGRASEALAAAGTAGLDNVILHVDWNQASIDSDRVCRDGDAPGDYVQWDPRELAWLHDWNVVEVADGRDFAQVLAAQRAAAALSTGQPTAVVYRTVKGRGYGLEGRGSHGAGHGFCSDAFHEALRPLLEERAEILPRCAAGEQRCGGGAQRGTVEECAWEALEVVRETLAADTDLVDLLAERLRASRRRLDARGRRPRRGAPSLERLHAAVADAPSQPPLELRLAPGADATLRGELGRVLGVLNRASDGAVLTASADLVDSTSASAAAEGLDRGLWHRRDRPAGRLLSIGGICEDAIAGVSSGIAAFGRHLPVSSSYGAFNAPLGHVAARLHAIGMHARREATGRPYDPFLLVCAHAGLETGEDGPTHADPQALQLLQENFPAATCITLTPWDPQELWPLVHAALARRPAVLAPFVTRPPMAVPDRAALGLPPASAAATGVYALRRTGGRGDGTVVLQGSSVTHAFVTEALPRLDAEGLRLNVFSVASAELFDLLPPAERERIFPEDLQQDALGITGFTMATLYRWVRSEVGRAQSLHPFRRGGFLGSGSAQAVLVEAGLDGASQFRAVVRFARERGSGA